MHLALFWTIFNWAGLAIVPLGVLGAFSIRMDMFHARYTAGGRPTAGEYFHRLDKRWAFATLCLVIWAVTFMAHGLLT